MIEVNIELNMPNHVSGYSKWTTRFLVKSQEQAGILVQLYFQSGQTQYPVLLCFLFSLCGEAVVGNACLVRGGMPRQREEWSHHVGPI